MAKTMTQAMGDLGNGTGFVYVADGSGALPTTARPGISALGFPNTPYGVDAAYRLASTIQSPSVPGYATGYVEITSAAADNLTAFQVGGIAQISAPVAMVSGDITASVTAIVNAINSHKATSNDFAAKQVGDTIMLVSSEPTAAVNGAVISLTFSGASTASVSSPVSGGKSRGTRNATVFIDADYGGAGTATDSTIAGAAIEITDSFFAKGLHEPLPSLEAVIATNTLKGSRISSIQEVPVDGISTSPNSIGNAENEIHSISLEGSGLGDIIILTGISGAIPPKVMDGPDIELDHPYVMLDDEKHTLWLRYNGDGSYTQVVPSAVSTTTARDAGIPAAVVKGAHFTAPSASTFSFKPGQTGTSGSGSIYEHSFILSGAGVSLGGNMAIRVDLASAIDNDRGTVYASYVPITLGGNQVNLLDGAGATQVSIPADLALKGNWAATWEVVDASASEVRWTLTAIPNSGTTKYTSGATLSDLSVPDSAIAAVSGAKITTGTVPESALDAALQAKINSASASNIGNILFVADPSDLPAAVSGVHTITGGTVLYIAGNIDLNGNRIEFAGAGAIIGSTSETSTLTSTGLGTSTPLITTSFTLPIQNVSFVSVGTAVAISGGSSDAYDWKGTNFVSVPTIGLVNGAGNVVLDNCAFIDSNGFRVSGTISSLVITTSLLLGDGTSANTIEFLGSANITRRVRIEDCAVVSTGSNTAISLDATFAGSGIPKEQFIIKGTNFSGAGTYLNGIAASDDIASFSKSPGIGTTYVFGEMYMYGNSTATTVSLALPNKYKIAGNTTGNVKARFSHNPGTPNRMVYTGAEARYLEIIVDLTFAGTSGDKQEFHIRKNGTTYLSTYGSGEIDAAGRDDNTNFRAYSDAVQGDYFEVFVGNDGPTNVTAVNMHAVFKNVTGI